MPSNYDDADLTGHVRSDIVMLSSKLNGQQTHVSALEHNRNDEKLTLLTHISALLNTGDDNAPLAHSIHAVYGRLTPATLECLVCSDVPQTEQETKGMQTTPALPDPGHLTSIPDAGDAIRGSQLLDKWDKADQRNYSLKDHLRDVFQVLSYLKPSSAAESLEAFSFFIHRRAFRKLGWCIKEFLTYLNDSPFTVLKTVDFTSISAQQFAIPFTPAEYVLLQLKPTYALPTREAVLGGVGSIQLIMKLKPVLKHILLVSGVESTLLHAMIAARQKKPHHHQKIFEAFQFPTTSQASGEKQPDNNQATNTKNMSAAGDVKDMFATKDMEDTSAMTMRIRSDEMAIENEDEKDNLPLDFPHASESVHSLLQSVYSILAWQTAVKSLSKHLGKFAEVHMRVQFFECDWVEKIKQDSQMKAKLNEFFPGLELGQKSFGRMSWSWSRAKVHAEAMLMAWVFTQSKMDPSKFFKEEIPIATGKQCCYLCYRLQEKLNDVGSLKFCLPGSHHSIFAWIPPCNVPDQILVELRSDLLHIVSNILAQHSRQTSTVSSNSSLDHTSQTDQAMAEVFKKLQRHTNTG
ncbi:hypothetical protein GGU10DRAFT_437046 [Lentinula aff. detonsa]|uniref:Uncharacterized protein n=1 Tax=Lentinula aff. detonsa TaxID=2804958 RepID=A0AA38KLM3_9AGAR|nr:hypothetical protein GGU10DRAFT_437046 [Lentinula aff. detonsa]